MNEDRQSTNNKKTVTFEVLKRLDYSKLPDYIADKEFLCLSCLYKHMHGTVMFVEDFCENCLRYYRHPSNEDKSNFKHKAARTVCITALSLNVGATILMRLIDYYNWETITFRKVYRNIYSIIKDVFTSIYNGESSGNKYLMHDIVEFCASPRILKIIGKYYTSLYNETCRIGQGNLQLIERISVRNLFGYHSYDLKIKDPSMSIIIGTNGLGKTTIFRILQSILLKGTTLYDCYEKLEYISSVPFDSIIIYFSDGKKLELLQKSNGINKELLIRIYPKLDIFLRFQPNDSLKNELYKLHESNKHWLTACDSAYILEIINIKHLYEQIDKTFPKLQVESDRFLFIETKRIKLSKLNEEIVTLSKKSNFSDKLLKLSNYFSKLYFENDPSRKTLILTDDNKLMAKTSTDMTIDLDLLSSGEQGVLLTLYQIMFHTGKNSIVLVDEPEISLHIAWQKKLTEIINEILEDKFGTQVIMASHSPFIAASNQDLIVEANLYGSD